MLNRRVRLGWNVVLSLWRQPSHGDRYILGVKQKVARMPPRHAAYTTAIILRHVCGGVAA